MENNVEIGIKVVGTIYLHVFDDIDLTTPFDIDHIDLVVENEDGGSTIYYIGLDDNVPYSSKSILEKYKVKEDRESIEESIKKLKYYKKEALDKINSLLE